MFITSLQRFQILFCRNEILRQLLTEKKKIPKQCSPLIKSLYSTLTSTKKYKLLKEPWRLTTKQNLRQKVAKSKTRNLKTEGSFY